MEAVAEQHRGGCKEGVADEIFSSLDVKRPRGGGPIRAGENERHARALCVPVSRAEISIRQIVVFFFSSSRGRERGREWPLIVKNNPIPFHE